MKRERIILLRKHIEKLPARLINNNTFGSSYDDADDKCHAPACVGGWAIRFFGDSSIDYGSSWDEARRLLGLTIAQANRTFDTYGSSPYDVVPVGVYGSADWQKRQKQSALNRLDALLAVPIRKRTKKK